MQLATSAIVALSVLPHHELPLSCYQLMLRCGTRLLLLRQSAYFNWVISYSRDFAPGTQSLRILQTRFEVHLSGTKKLSVLFLHTNNTSDHRQIY